MADGITFDSSEVINLAHQLQESTTEIRTRAAQVVRAAGSKVERDAKVAAPVDTGYLRNSISTRVSGNANTSTAEVTAGADYAAYVEFGTSRMSPQPYMIPAFERNKQPFIDALQQLVDGALG